MSAERVERERGACWGAREGEGGARSELRGRARAHRDEAAAGPDDILLFNHHTPASAVPRPLVNQGPHLSVENQKGLFAASSARFVRARELFLPALFLSSTLSGRRRVRPVRCKARKELWEAQSSSASQSGKANRNRKLCLIRSALNRFAACPRPESGSNRRGITNSF